MIGFTLHKSALTHWLITRHITAEYTDEFRGLSDQKRSNLGKHAEHSFSHMRRDEEDVKKVTEYLSNSQNPSNLKSVPNELINIATGQIATVEVATSMGHFLEEAKKTNSVFFKKRLLEERTVSFGDTDSRFKIHVAPFAAMSISLKQRNKDENMVDSEVLLQRLLAVSKQRDVSLEDVMY